MFILVPTIALALGQRFDGTMYALIGGFALFGAATHAAVRFTGSARGAPGARPPPRRTA